MRFVFYFNSLLAPPSSLLLSVPVTPFPLHLLLASPPTPAMVHCLHPSKPTAVSSASSPLFLSQSFPPLYLPTSPYFPSPITAFISFLGTSTSYFVPSPHLTLLFVPINPPLFDVNLCKSVFVPVLNYPGPRAKLSETVVTLKGNSCASAKC